MRKLYLLTVLFFKINSNQAQDANYWSCSYGPGSFVVPGATIARNGDSGVLFYNPALLAYNTKNAASVSGSIYNYQSIKIKNGAGTGLSLNSTNTSIVPVIASNTIYLNLKGKPITIAWALLNNPVMNFSTTQRRDDKLNVLDDSYSPGPENFIGQYTHSNSSSETAGILAFGTTISPKVAAGISFTLQSRSQTFLTDSRSRALINSNDELFQKLVTVSEYYLAGSTNINLGIKAGLSFDIAPNQNIGIVVSSPFMHLYGKAELYSDFIVNNLKLGPLDLFLLANTKQSSLKSKWKMPLSAAAGYSYNFGKGHLYLATEYFTKVKEYNLITPNKEYFIRPDTGNNNLYTPDLLRLKDARKSIINFSAAISYNLTETITGYCSIRTDYNYGGYQQYQNDDGYIGATAAWNQYHLNLGANFRKRNFNLRAALLLTHGTTGNYKQRVNYDNPNENNVLVGDIGLTRARRSNTGLMLTYIHNL
jgi:hypothetical protein